MFREIEFQPLPLMRSPHVQTIVGSYTLFPTFLSSESIKIHLKDGDALKIEVSTPPDWKEGDKITLLVHGLGGDHTSCNMTRIGKKLYKEGHLVYRINLRGCGSGAGLAKKALSWRT